MYGDLTSGAEPERTMTYVAAMRTAQSVDYSIIQR